MTTINLHQNQQEAQEKDSSRSANGGLFFSLGILIITILAFVGLKVVISVIEKQNEALVAAAQSEEDSLSGLGDLQRIIDVQNRLGAIKSNLQIKNSTVSRIQMTQVLHHLGADIDTGIVLSSYKFNDDNTVSLTFDASNFSDASKQIMSFKNSDYFTGVNLTKISRGEKAVVCDVTMIIKQ